jgi:glycine/D-amino acid oxidase-like deaminating enzyme
LRESGRSVVLVDAFGSGNPKSSSGAAWRVIRMGYGPAEIYTRWAMRSLTGWKKLAARVHRPELFQHTGVLWTARPGHPHTAGTLSAFRELAVPHQVLTHAEIARRYPLMHFPDEVAGIFEPESGGLLASQAVQAVTQEAARLGAQVVRARIVAPSEEEIEHLTTEDGRRLTAETFIFACGPWLPQLFPQAVGARIRVTRQPLFYFDCPSVEMPIWLDFSDPRGPYTIPPVAGKGFKLGLDRHGPAFDPDTGSRAVTAAETAEARAFLTERFPSLAEAPLTETEVCQYESTSNGDFLIDRHPRMSNVWLVGGGSGHGFKHGPAVGEYVTAQLDGGIAEGRFGWRTKSQTAARAIY